MQQRRDRLSHLHRVERRLRRGLLRYDNKQLCWHNVHREASSWPAMFEYSAVRERPYLLERHLLCFRLHQFQRRLLQRGKDRVQQHVRRHQQRHIELREV